MTIDLAARKVSDAQVAGMVTEFPRINDALEALPTRFVYLPTLTDTLRQANPPSATFNTMMKINTETGDVVRHDFGNKIAGEATFIPRGANGEDDGYLAILCLRSDEPDQRSGPARRGAHRRRSGRRDPDAAARATGTARQLDSESLICRRCKRVIANQSQAPPAPVCFEAEMCPRAISISINVGG